MSRSAGRGASTGGARRATRAPSRRSSCAAYSTRVLLLPRGGRPASAGPLLLRPQRRADLPQGDRL
eukprot:3111644-Prymnesium_polylepis.1